MKRQVKNLRRGIKLLIKPWKEEVIQRLCAVSRWFASFTHRKLRELQWNSETTPEHFDHQINLYYQWLKTRNCLGWERGIFSGLALRGGDVLELACGDGFNARNFYSLRSRNVVACDFDPAAIRTALRKNPADNVQFILADIRTQMPKGEFDNVVWDAAIEHFTPVEIDKIMRQIKSRLIPQGILSGYTIVERADGQKSLSHHEYEFKSKDDLKRFFIPYFQNVIVFETVYPDRHNLYFWASDGPVPFQAGWPRFSVSFHPENFRSSPNDE